VSAGRPTQTPPQAWVQAALDEVEASGVAGLAVERVARRLGVSKGGFYHHFADRRELLRAALELWQQRFVVELTVRLDAIEDPAERLHATLMQALVELEPTVIVRLMAAVEDPLVAAALANATRTRLALLTRTFAQLGFSHAAARHRALTAYGVYLGVAELRREDPDLLRTPARRRAYLADLEATLHIRSE
jgi:AcrR family transcriptional regulator